MNHVLHSYTKVRTLEQTPPVEGALEGAFDAPHLKAFFSLIIGLLFMLIAALPVRAQEAYASRAKQMDRPTYRVDLLESNLARLNEVIAVHLEEASIKEAFEHVAERSPLRLSYGQEALSVDKRVTLKDEQVTVLEALHEIIRGTPLQLQLSRSGYVIVTKVERAPGVREVASPVLQTGAIAGRVVDARTGEGIPGANVVITGSTMGGATGLDGSYRIEDLEPGTYEVQASFIGYQAQTIEDVPVASDEVTELDFALEEGVADLDEVTVVGYGEQRRTETDRSRLEPGMYDVQEYKLLYPIPQREIALDSRLTQNPGW